jgi:hypothetical protein
MPENRYGVPDAENPEWTDEDFARARRWRIGDPLGRPLTPGDHLRSAANALRDEADRLCREADRLDAASENTPPHAAE